MTIPNLESMFTDVEHRTTPSSMLARAKIHAINKTEGGDGTTNHKIYSRRFCLDSELNHVVVDGVLWKEVKEYKGFFCIGVWWVRCDVKE